MQLATAFRLATALALTLLLEGCTSIGPLAQPSVEFTKAARGFVDTLGGDYVDYVDNDSTLTPAQRLNRVEAVGDFEFAVRQAEKAHGLTAPAEELEEPELPTVVIEPAPVEGPQ